MSCSPCTMNISASGGMTSADATSICDQVGTTPNTGGAYLPDSYAGLSSFVAAAYAFARSASISVVAGAWRGARVLMGGIPQTGASRALTHPGPPLPRGPRRGKGGG